MATKDRRKLQHIHSSIADKQPIPQSLEVGEIAVNNYADKEFLSLKNSNDKVVRFSSDSTIINWVENKEVVPYKGYVRGEIGPSATSGDTPSADAYGSYGITDNDLLTNKSNIIVKINQVAAKNTVKYNKINAAKDRYNKDINPSENTPTGKTDGAGFFIDMSRYAMQGANPTFSSITTTCHTTLNGTTEIKGNDDECGSKFAVEVANACIDASDTLNEYGVNHSNFGISCDGTNISNDTTLKGKKVFIDSPIGNLTVDIQACNHISGRTNDFVIRECQDNDGKVEIDTTDIDVSASTTDIKSCDRISAITDNFIVEQCSSGKTHIHSCAGITLESKNIALTDGNCGSGQATIEVNDLCLVGITKNNVFGEKTNIGLDCDDSEIATDTRIFGKGTLITTNSDSTKYASQDNVEIVAAKDINETAGRNINETATGNINESTANGNISESAKNINNTASNDICDTAANNATFYGAVKTNVGINCDDTATAATTTVKGGKVIVDASTTDLGLTAKQDILESSERDIIITANEDVCETAGENATFYGAEKTNIGLNCDDSSSSTTTNVYGAEINLSGETTDATSCEHFYINTNDFKLKQCEDSQGSAEFKFCEDFNVQSNAITLEECDSGRGTIIIKETNEIISGTNLTVNEGDDVKFNIGDDLIINTSGGTNISTTGETQIKSIENICVISNSDANFGGDINTRIGADCDGNSGYSNNTYITASLSAFTYAPTIINSGTTNNNTFVTLNTTANTINQSGDTYNVTATTEVHSTTSFTVNSAVDACINSDDVASIGGANKTNIGYDCDGEILSNETNIYGGDVNISGDTVNITGDTYITGGLCVTKGLCKKLTWSYGDVKTGGTCTDNSSTNFSADTCFTIPRCVSDINRATLTYSYGDVRDLHESSGGTYDPGENCDGVKVTDHVTIPTSMDHLAEFNGTCYTLSHDVCMENNTIVAKGFYSSSDRRLKDNISNLSREDLEKVGDIAFKSFTFANDGSKTKTYGVIAQDVQDAGLGNIVHTNSDGMLNVDYTSLLLLRIAKMEDVINDLESKIENLSNRLNFGK